MLVELKQGEKMKRNRAALTTGALVLALVLPGQLFAAPPDSSGDFKAGIDIRQQVAPKDVGLPVYPGATIVRDDDDDNSSIAFSLAFGAFGLKIAAITYASADRIDAIVNYYRDALAIYGPVLDCSDNRAGHPHEKHTKDDTIQCEDDHPDTPTGRLLKSGTKTNQYVFEINPHGSENHFSLVHLHVRDDQ
jgi:hypothetical protein